MSCKCTLHFCVFHPVLCGEIAIPHSTREGGVGPYATGQTISLTCDPCYNGGGTMKCLPGGKWDKMIQCTCKKNTLLAHKYFVVNKCLPVDQLVLSQLLHSVDPGFQFQECLVVCLQTYHMQTSTHQTVFFVDKRSHIPASKTLSWMGVQSCTAHLKEISSLRHQCVCQVSTDLLFFIDHSLVLYFGIGVFVSFFRSWNGDSCCKRKQIDGSCLNFGANVVLEHKALLFLILCICIK